MAEKSVYTEDKPLGNKKGRKGYSRPKDHSKPLFFPLKKKDDEKISSVIKKNTKGTASCVKSNLKGFFLSLFKGVRCTFCKGLFMGISIIYFKVKRQFKRNSLQIFRFIGRSSRLWLPIGVLAMLITIVLSANTYCIALEVIMDGKTLGYVHGQNDFEVARANAETSITSIVGDTYHLNIEPQYAFAIVKHEEITELEKIEGELTESAKADLGQTYGLYIEGELLAVNESEDDLLDLLDSIKEPYLAGTSGETVNFQKSVEIAKGVYPKNQLLDIDEIKNLLVVPQDTVTYTVKKGDTAGAIANQFSLSLASLKTLNKGVNVNKLTVGGKLKIANAGTILGVEVVRTVKYNEAIDYSTEKQNTNTLYKGEEKVKTAGGKGIREITATVTYVDGEEVGRIIDSNKVVKKPVNKVILVGTKSVAPSGKFRWPVGGTGGKITSTFYDRRGSSRHNAIDIAATRGTPVLAADGGTVYSVNYSGVGYGNQLVIDHGNGIRTRYAHCSKIYVKVGQKVPKGYTVAAVGSTGWSTGPHLHFEIMKISKSGAITFVNPLTLVKK